MSSTQDNKGAEVKFPPPLIFIFFIITGYGAHYFYPTHISASYELNSIGAALTLLALSFIFYLSRVFMRADTNIEPWKPTTTIITAGVYAYSRNPIYVAFCIATIGIGILLNSLWVLCSFIPSALLVYFIAIKKEELYLEKQFGDAYLQYKKRVRRWV